MLFPTGSLCRCSRVLGMSQQPTKPAWLMADAFFPAGLPAALAPVLLSCHNISACTLDVQSNKCQGHGGDDKQQHQRDGSCAEWPNTAVCCAGDRSWNLLVRIAALWLWAHLEQPHLSKTRVMTHIWTTEALNRTSSSYTESGKCIFDRRGLF